MRVHSRTIEGLKALRGLLARGWTQDCLARTKYGVSCHPRSDQAAQWCVVGGLCYVADCDIEVLHQSPLGRDMQRALLAVVPDIDTFDLSTWNDEHAHNAEEVCAAIDQAIFSLKPKEAPCPTNP